MTVEDAKKMIEGKGFSNVIFLEEEDGMLFFDCESDGEEVSVFVKDGEITVSPT